MVGEGIVGEGRVGEGRVGEGRVGEGRVGEGRVGEQKTGLWRNTPVESSSRRISLSDELRRNTAKVWILAEGSD
jgi:hypothetical protein